jgi:hypothetical protein
MHEHQAEIVIQTCENIKLLEAVRLMYGRNWDKLYQGMVDATCFKTPNKGKEAVALAHRLVSRVDA